MILTTPLLERLAAVGPVDVVATPASAPLLANHPAVRHVVVYDKRGVDRGVAGVRRVAAQVRALNAGVAYLAQGSMRTAAVARLAGIGRRVGFDTSPGRLLYSDRVAFRAELHHAERLWTLASSPGDPVPPRLRPSLYPGVREQDTVDALLRAAGCEPFTPLIALAPGSVWATKRWPAYNALAQHVAEDATFAGARIVVVGGAGDSPLAAAISDALRATGAAPAIDATGQLSLLASAALLARARVLVTNDSAPLHLASAVNTPTVALFGPTVPAFGFGPLADRRRSLGEDGLPCRPCSPHGPQECPLGHWRCMRDLDARRVASAAAEVIAGYFPA